MPEIKKNILKLVKQVKTNIHGGTHMRASPYFQRRSCYTSLEAEINADHLTIDSLALKSIFLKIKLMKVSDQMYLKYKFTIFLRGFVAVILP